jgi:flagellar biosynthetic protein FlhB
MADERSSSQERTESATPRRRDEARREGKIPRSQELSAAVVLLAGTVVLAGVGGRSLTEFATALLRDSTRLLSAGPMTAASGVAELRLVTWRMGLALLPFLTGLGGIVALANLIQARGVVSWGPVTPRLSHLDPLAGIRRIVSADGAFNLIKSAAKLLALGLVTWFVIVRSWPEIMSLTGTGPGDIAVVLGALLIKLAMTTGLAFLGLALVDYGFQWFRTEKGMRMSREEVMREHRESEGDPLIKGRILSIARARARKRMLQAVPTADVVVVNPVHVAVALRYDTDVALAPVVVAMGERKLAERIKAIAIKADVPIVENVAVTRALLATAVVGRAIPPALYAAIAEILAYVYKKRGGLPGMRAALASGGRR